MTTPAPAPVRPTLAAFWRDLPREGRLLLSIVVVEFVGTGLVLPFSVVYLHEVRGFALSDVGLLLGVPPLVALAITGPGGTLIDRLGARTVVIGAVVLVIASDVVLAFADTLVVAAVAMLLNGLAQGVQFPAFNAMIAAVVPSEARQRYFGLNFTLLNLGIGVGGVLGGLVVDVDRAITFQAIYLVDAASFVPILLLLLGPLRAVAPRPEPHDREDGDASYRAILAAPGMRPVILLVFASAFVGYAQLNAGMPAYARVVGEVSTQGLGIAFAANTIVIVLLQLVVLQRIEGHRRTRVLVAMGVVWAFSWLLLGLSGLVPGTIGATLLVAACAAVFALGETLLQPTLPAIINDLAPDDLRGRYNALFSGAFQSASVVAPPIAGALLGADRHTTYILLLVAGSLACSYYAVARVERALPAGANGGADRAAA